MNLKFTLLFVASFHLFLLEPCHSRPIFSYLFGEEEAELPTEIVTSELLTAAPKILNANVGSSISDVVTQSEPTVVTTGSGRRENKVDAKPAVLAAQTNAVQNAVASGAETMTLRPQPMTGGTRTQPKLGNVGFPLALNTVAFAARALNSGVRGAKALVNGSTNLTTQTIGGVRTIGNVAIDGMQDAIDGGAQKTLSKMDEWTKRMNNYRKGLSGTIAKDVDKAHSITITTSSATPVKSINEFLSSYLPADTGDASLIEFTSLDLSKLW